jgi:hypothetical protein
MANSGLPAGVYIHRPVVAQSQFDVCVILCGRGVGWHRIVPASEAIVEIWCGVQRGSGVGGGGAGTGAAQPGGT